MNMRVRLRPFAWLPYYLSLVFVIASFTATTAVANIFVANLFGGTVGEYTDSGAPINPTLIAGLDSPFGLAVSGNFLYVTSRDAGTVGKYTITGKTVNPTLVSGLDTPVGIAVSGNNLFVTKLNHGFPGSIGEYTTSGAVVNGSLITGLSVPMGIAVQGSHLFVIDYERGTLGEYTTSGDLVNGIALPIALPQAIAASETSLFITHFIPAVVGKYNLDLSTVNPTLITSLGSTNGIAVLGDNLLIADSESNRIAEFTRAGVPINTSLITGLNFPFGIATTGTTSVPDSLSTIWLAMPLCVMWLYRRHWVTG